MKGYLIAAVLAAGLMVAPAVAQNPSPAATLDVSNFSLSLLNHGLETVTVCSNTAGYGMRRFLQFYQDNKIDSTSDHNIAALALNAAVRLYHAEIVENNVLELMVKTLNQKHHKKMPDLIAVMTETMTAANTSLQDKYDSVVEFDQFAQAFEAAVGVCDKAMNSFVDAAEREQNHLEKDK